MQIYREGGKELIKTGQINIFNEVAFLKYIYIFL